MAYVSNSDPAAKMAADRAKVGAQLGNGADVLAASAGPLRDIAASLREVARFPDEAAGILP